MTKCALVLGGGSVAGIAWQTGVITGMADAGVDVRDADVFVGTSGGACVAAQITSGLTLEELFQRQVDPALQARELAAQMDLARWSADLKQAMEGAGDITELMQRRGAMALATHTVTEAERRIFNHASGVDLVDAVAASCAIPGVWPPVTIDGHRYIDGGTYANENADLASGFERVLVLAPDVPAHSPITLDAHSQQLRREGARVDIVHFDEVTKKALAVVGGNLLDPAVRERAAYAGRAQGRSIASQLYG
ncbi:patatin [Ktedonobacter sp. SOSP1-52]|uniref:patatin-like phospholipase family protein n=1 Tax=Ktedonobacter sp. SOSP1-52 TaxID=2778366 RepID=UPI0019153578|nr:patatin-like phospholipase family protein [Ktedonobacter sp. SOSP1-52]GHO68303.1 patatin [Ktedonobacter sp. SOSP1-52]